MTKSGLNDLAIFGGQAAFDTQLHVGRPNIGDRNKLLGRFQDILDRRWLSNHGRYVQEFENRVAEIVGVEHCIAMCNATVALEIIIRALGLKGEVIVPSFTFIATAHALQWLGITPVFCDIDPQTHNLDPKRVVEMITPATSAIMGVHLWGRPCPFEELEEIAAERKLKLVFDAAHAFGCSHKGKMIGAFGDAEVFSFHATKFFNTFEGGAVVTNDAELAARVRLMKNFGFAGYDNVVDVGTNGKMPEISAAMGLTGLESLSEFIAINRRNYEQYRLALDGIPGVKMITYDHREQCNFQYIVMEIDEAITQVSRDQLIDILWAENVLARRYFYPGCHRMEPYRTLFPEASSFLPETERVADRVVVLPTGTAMSVESIDQLCALIRDVVAHGKTVRERLEERALGVAQ